MQRFDAQQLRTFSCSVLTAAGLAQSHAEATADTLVAADLLGYSTHGIQFLPQYCAALEAGQMTHDGAPQVIADHGATLVYDGDLLPGPSCVRSVVSELLSRAGAHSLVTATIRHSANTACLATYLLPIVEAGYVGIIMVSSPAGHAVAPAGGRKARYSTNPIAFGFPTGGDPVLIDMATSATTNRLTEKRQRDGTLHVGEPMIDAEGRPTNDPFALTKQAGGAIRPFGGDANEHKGFALALAVQAMSAALAGGGGAGSGRRPLGSTVFVQVIDPAAFAGSDAFNNEMDHLVAKLMDTPPRPGSAGVRIPGQRAMDAYRRQSTGGVEISDELRRHVEPVAEKYRLTFPTAIV